MNAREMLLRAIQDEWIWTQEGPKGNTSVSPVNTMKMKDWASFGVGESVGRETTALRIDGELVFGDALNGFPKGEVARLNPRYVAVRFVDSITKVRESIVLIREDVYPTEGELDSVGYY